VENSGGNDEIYRKIEGPFVDYSCCERPFYLLGYQKFYHLEIILP
jgi:hypothetical protein